MNDEVITVELREVNKTLARIEHDVKNVRVSQESQRDRITRLEAHFEDHWKADQQISLTINTTLDRIVERVAAIEAQQPVTLLVRNMGMKFVLALVLANAAPSSVVYFAMKQSAPPASVERTTTETIVRPQPKEQP